MKTKANTLLFTNKTKKDFQTMSKVKKSKRVGFGFTPQHLKHAEEAKLKHAFCNEQLANENLRRHNFKHSKVEQTARLVFQEKEIQEQKRSPGLVTSPQTQSKIKSESSPGTKQEVFGSTSYTPYNNKSKSKLQSQINPKKEQDKLIYKSCDANKNSKCTSKPNKSKDFKQHSDLKNIESKLEIKKVSASVNGLLKLIQKGSKGKLELLDLDEPIFMNVECIKMPVCPTKQLRFKLPHPVVNELSDILLIVPDKKGAKIHPDKAVDHYTDLLHKHNIQFINKVLPLRQLKQEYSQFEMRRKLVDQFDIILADGAIAKSLPKILGKYIMFKRKMPIAVHLSRRDLKKHLTISISKTQMAVKSNSVTSVVQVGNTKMDAQQITANIIEVCKSLPHLYPGGWDNIRSLGIKTSDSAVVLVYISLVSPNAVQTPVEVPQQQAEVIEGELTTFPDTTVTVYPDGTVLKKVGRKRDQLLDDSQDDEILKEAAAYAQSSRTVRHSDDESSDEERDSDAVTEAAENKLLDKYEKSVSKRRSEQEEDGEEEEESSDDEEEPITPPNTKSKKRKLEPPQKQAKGGASTPKQKEKSKGPISLPQRRGSRGGKKSKVSKDQRKAMIKRKKAGKN